MPLGSCHFMSVMQLRLEIGSSPRGTLVERTFGASQVHLRMRLSSTSQYLSNDILSAVDWPTPTVSFLLVSFLLLLGTRYRFASPAMSIPSSYGGAPDVFRAFFPSAVPRMAERSSTSYDSISSKPQWLYWHEKRQASFSFQLQ